MVENEFGDRLAATSRSGSHRNNVADVSEGALETKACRFGMMSFFKNDTTVSRSLRDYGEWAQAEVEFLQYLIGPRDTVLDIGAFIGTHALAFAQKLRGSGKVYAFEPQPSFFEVLTKNIEQSAFRNITAFNAAVSDSAGRLRIPDIDTCRTHNFAGTSILGTAPAADSVPYHTVEVTTIDHLVLDRCDLIKIDTEGMEINVLRGARKTIESKRPIIFAECNSLEYGWPVVELLRDKNYSTYLLNATSYNPENFRGNPNNFFQDCRETGLLLVPKEQIQLIQDRLDPARNALMIPIACIDDLALGLLKKPQYKYEIASKLKAASVLGVDFWANEPEARQLKEKIQQEETTIGQNVQEVARLTRERETLQGTIQQEETTIGQNAQEMALLTREQEALLGTIRQQENRIAQVTQEREALLGTIRQQENTLARLTRDRETVQGTLNAIYSSHGWKLLSFYYRWRDKFLNDDVKRGIGRCLLAPHLAFHGLQLFRDMRLIAASGLFNSEWYLEQNPDVAKAGVNPLRHYLRRGAIEGRDPNPFFDSDWYLERNPDVAKAGINPLRHYLRRGATEGRDPSPLFNTTIYLGRNPDVAKTGLNPLAHYLASGAHNQELGRRPTNPPSRATENVKEQEKTRTWLKRLILDPRPISLPGSPAQFVREDGDRRLICVSHVLPYPARAGNEYRIQRMLSWLAGRGFDTFLVVCPLPGNPITTQQLTEACAIYPNMILCQRDGTLLYRIADGDAAMKKLSGVRPRPFGKLLDEKDGGPEAQRLLSAVRTFCPDMLIEILLALDEALQPEVFWVNYVWMTRVLPLLRPEVLKVLDTHDVFSSKRDKFAQFGIEDSCTLTPQQEAKLLEFADLVIAIQSEEATELRRLAPSKRVVTAGVDAVPIDSIPLPTAHPVILLVASDNQLNVKGLKDFLRFAWGLICREAPAAELRVVGTVGSHIDIDDPSIKVLGPIENLAAAYAEARVVINPAIAGSGLKIKTVEALWHLRPVVVWPCGVEGVEAELQKLCFVATDWYSFARHVINLCKTEAAAYELLNKRDQIRQAFSADRVYRELAEAFADVHEGLKQSSQAASGSSQ